MLGTFRYILALMVAFCHLWMGPSAYLARFSVFAFYMLSGYLITRILNETYHYTPGGLARFALNRALRIYPAYFTVFALCLLLHFIAPEHALHVSAALKDLPANGAEWLHNIVIFGLSHWLPDNINSIDPHRIVDNSWSLSIELCFYVLMALGLSRHMVISAFWFATGIVVVAYELLNHYPFYDLYLPIIAGTLPFATGALIYHGFRRWQMPPHWKENWLAVSLAIWIAVPVMAHFNLIEANEEGLFLSLIPSAGLLIGFLHLKPSDYSVRAQRRDKLLGNLSYPLFLVHWGTGIIMMWLIPGLSQRHATLFLASLPLLHFLAWAIYMGVERPIEAWRNRVRPAKLPAL